MEGQFALFMQRFAEKYGGRFEAIEKKQNDLVGRLKEVKKKVSSSNRVSSAPPNGEASSIGNGINFLLRELYVNGFYDHSTGTGELDASMRDALATRLTNNIPAELKDKFKLDKR